MINNSVLLNVFPVKKLLTIQQQLKKKLFERLEHPHVKANRLRGFANHYKIMALETHGNTRCVTDVGFFNCLRGAIVVSHLDI